MKIYIPSRSRFQRSLTLNALAPPGEKAAWPREDIALVVPQRQVAQYAALAERHGVQVLPCPVNGIAATRKFIGEHTPHDHFLMLDDDLRFFYRPIFLVAERDEDEGLLNEKARLYKNPVEMTTAMLNRIDALLHRYAHVAISAREGNQNLPYPLEECNRPLRALAYRKGPFLQCEHGRVAIMEDFDVTLQLMKMGYKNAIITDFAQDQIATQMEGGCSDYRTHALHQKNVLKMVELHTPFVVPREKENKGGGEFGKRTEATIYWKKMYAHLLKEYGL